MRGLCVHCQLCQDGVRDREVEYYPRLAAELGRQLYRDHHAAQTEQTLPARGVGTWHWSNTAISKGHYLAHGPGGLIQG